MSRDTGKTKSSRRAFLRDVVAMGGVTVAVVSAGADTAASAVPAGKPRAASPKGYRVTPHVAKYYDKARI